MTNTRKSKVKLTNVMQREFFNDFFVKESATISAFTSNTNIPKTTTVATVPEICGIRQQVSSVPFREIRVQSR
jgi:hypothetical protein